MEGLKKRPLVALLAPVEGPKPLLAPMEGPKPLLAPMKGPKQRKFWSDEMIKVLLDKCIEEMKSTGRNGTSLHKQSWASISANGDDQWTNTEIGESASVSAASASRPPASRASAIRERVGALNMDDDPLVDVAVHVDDDDDDGNSRAHKINDELRPKKKSKDLPCYG
nr:myb/SANT-like domain, Harbinger transposase-derived nuclease domain protein [Tanacetum cinerariifolium]